VPLSAAAAAAGAELDGAALATLVGEARDRQRQVTRERRLLKELRDGLDGLPMVELPSLAGGAGGPDEVRTLATHLVPGAPASASAGAPAGASADGSAGASRSASGNASAGADGGLWTAPSSPSGHRLPSRSGAPLTRGSGDAHPETEAGEAGT
jgi:hypothetical protein